MSTINIILLILIFVVTLMLVLVKRTKPTVNNVSLSSAPKVPPSTFLGSLEYFGGPYNFLKINAEKLGKFYSFSLLGQEVYFIGTSVDARDLFFKSNPETLHFYEGYKELFGAIIGKELFSDHNYEIGKLIKPEILKRYFVDVIQATPIHLEKLWGKKGKVDLFHTVYKSVFRMTLRIMGCKEIADDHFEEFSKCYHILDSEFSALSIFLPWFPDVTQIKRYFARKKIFSLLDPIIQKRIDTANYADDTLSKIVEHYRETDGVVDKDFIKFFCMATMFAAQTNTALAAAWSLTYLLANPEHCQTAVDEIKSTIARHNGNLTYEGLEEMKFLDRTVLEALRLTISSGGWWRKVMADMEFEGKSIPAGSLVVNNPALYHLDDSYFKDALKFNPYRDDTNPNVAFGYGKHPCLGRKMAILEVKVFLASVFTTYNVAPLTEAVPEVNRNTMHGSWPIKLPFVEVEKMCFSEPMTST